MGICKTKLSLLLVASALAGCGKGAAGSGPKAEPDPVATRSTDSLDGVQETVIERGDAARFCTELPKLSLSADVQPELDLFCNKGRATELMLSLAAEASALGTGAMVPPKVIHREQFDEAQQTEMILVWAYATAVIPEVVKDRPINDYIAKSFEKDGIVVAAATGERQMLEDGLHIWSAPLDYSLRVTTDDGVDLESVRKAKYDMYQMTAASEDMGLGIEELAGENTDFKRSVMLNLTFVDEAGQTVIVNLLHMILDNRGFPQTAEKAVTVTGQSVAEFLFGGLQP